MHFLTFKDAEPFVTSCRTRHQKIVFTNGCFDLLHAGHIAYLSEAKALGDLLIVGINSDASVQRLKGKNRPIQSQDDRLLLISALKSVDATILFDEDTPISLIQLIKPEIHVKGGDYIADQLPEYPIVKSYGGEVKILPFVPGKSSSHIVQKILETYARD